jgi:DMSO/TMAO reductase YedYZ molybdopterin-dependent catalytic subunit
MTGTFERLRGFGPTLVLGVLAGVAGVLGSYAAAGFTPSFVIAPIDSYLAAVSPGFVITFAITVLGDLGQRIALLTAIGLAVAAFAALALVGTVAGRELAARTDRPAASLLAGPFLAALGVALFAFLLVPEPTPALTAGGAAAAVLAVGEAGRLSTAAGAPVSSEGRRTVLTGLAGALGVGVLGYLLGGRSGADASVPEAPASGSPGASTETGGSTGVETGPSSDDDASEPTATSEPSEVERLLRGAADLSLDVEGIEPLVSEKFYSVDINSVDPKLSAGDWSMRVTGAVEQELDFTYEDITSRESREEFVTLRCVGDSLNGKKMDNALWTVIDIEPLLEEAGITADSEQCCVMLRAADDFFEGFPLSALREGMLAYRMNGAPLPRKHGAPVRALIPGHWGEINVKWLTEIEILTEEMDGYWEQKGWHGTGPVNPVAKIHAINKLDDGRIELGGHAYAGTRGVSRVEVSTDNGATWTEATLSEPLPGDPRDAWRQWVYRYDPPDGKHVAVARMYDAEGNVQTREQSNPYPRGASGWVRETVRP